jgi:PAS domain S-box-containing protein
MALHEDKGSVVPFQIQPLPSRQRSKASVASEPALNVLVIDDTPQDRMAVRLALEAGGFVLQEAADAKQGLKLAQSSTPDCILLDHVLPDAAGLEVLQSLKEPGGTLPCAVVMLTGAGTADVATAAMKAGALDYLVKDRLDAEMLRRAIGGAVRQFRLMEVQRVAEHRNAQLAAIVAASSDAIISAGTDLAVQTWNAGAQRLFGYGETEARGRTLPDLIVPDVYRAETAAIYAAVMSDGTALLSETVRQHKDGRLIPVETSISPIFDGSGRVAGLSVILRDIGGRQRAEEALRRHAERQALLLEVTSDLIRASEPGELGRMTFERVSAALGADICFNYRLDPAGKRLRLVFGRGMPPEQLDAAQSLALGQAFCGAAAGGCEAIVADMHRIACDPKGAFVRDLGATAYACHPLMASDGRALGTFSVASTTREAFTGDEVAWLGTITNFLAQAWERFEAESRLGEREAQLALFVEHAPAAIAMFDGKMRYLAASRRYVADFRLPPDIGLIGRSHYDVFPDIPPRWREVHARVLAGEELSHEEDPFLRQDGRTDWCRWFMKPWRSADGRIGGALLFSEVITEQVAARRAFTDSEARFRATFENAAVGIAHFDPDFRWLRANEALCRILGYRPDELVTKSLEDINDPDDLRACLVQVERMRDRKIDSFGIDKRYRRKDGSIVWTRLTNGCVRKSDGSIDYFVCTFEDISARKHAEEELRKSEERFRSSLLHSPLPVLLFDDQEQILAVSQSWLEGSSYSREELRRIEDWTTRAHGARSGEALEQIRLIISTEPQAQPAEMMIRTKDGRERTWSFVSSALGAQSDSRRLFVCVAQDVTERKAHEEHVHLLMREVNHRAKNMLSLVQAIARQTAAREPEDFIGRFTERIQALAANQDLLVRNEWQGVDVEDLARAQLAPFADLVGSRIALHGPKLRLNAAAAQAIGLALHELATNAGKYGALSVGAGRVEVSWRFSRGSFAMNWTERNGPPVSRPERRGFGSTVVESMAKLSVGGEVELDYVPSGLIWRLTCPAANALDEREPWMRGNREKNSRRLESPKGASRNK